MDVVNVLLLLYRPVLDAWREFLYLFHGLRERDLLRPFSQQWPMLAIVNEAQTL